MVVKIRSSVVCNAAMVGLQETGLFALSVQGGSCRVSISLLVKPATVSEKLNLTVNAPSTGGMVSIVIPTVSDGSSNVTGSPTALAMPVNRRVLLPGDGGSDGTGGAAPKLTVVPSKGTTAISSLVVCPTDTVTEDTPGGRVPPVALIEVLISNGAPWGTVTTTEFLPGTRVTVMVNVKSAPGFPSSLRALRLVRPANTPAGSVSNWLFSKSRLDSVPRPANSPAGSVSNLLSDKSSAKLTLSESNTPTGSDWN